MDRATLLRHLAEAERHVAEGVGHLARQEEIIAELELRGHDSTEAHAIFDTLMETQTLHRQGRDRILKELEAIGGG